MVAYDIADGVPSHAPARLQTIFAALMPPETVALTAAVLARLPRQLPLFSRLLLATRNAAVFLRKKSLKPGSGDQNYLNAAIRKRIVYDEVVAAIEQGAEQVLMLGAGYDVLCLQLHRKYPQVLFVEVDQQNTQSTKRQAVVDVCGGALPENYAFVSVDFRYQSLEAELESQLSGAWRQQRKSIAIIEGVWPYLTEQAIRESLRSFKRIAAAGSSYVFTYFVLSGTPTQQWLTAASTKVFDFVGEPVRYLPTSKQQIETLLDAEGYKVDMSAQRTDGYMRYIAPAGFDDYVGRDRVLANFVGIAELVEGQCVQHVEEIEAEPPLAQLAAA